MKMSICFGFWICAFLGLVASAATGDVRFQTLKWLCSDAVCSDGQHPYAGLVAGSDSLLYGTTFYGGPGHDGTVFRINQDGSGYSVLHGFLGDYAAGEPNEPLSELIEGSNGVLYGTTWDSGIGWDPRPGVVYRLNKDGSSFGVVYAFTNAVSYGSPGFSALVEGPDEALYGTTAVSKGAIFGGIVFRITDGPTGLSVLHQFSGGDDGGNPAAGLTLGSDRTLYGTTSQGGTNGGGTVFALQLDGTGFRVLHHFGSEADGGNPRARLIDGSDGVLYGTTSPYTNGVCTVFKLNRDGSGYAVLLCFLADFDQAGLVEGHDGALYGTASMQGAGAGVFRLRKDGTAYRVLYHFGGLSGPASGLIQGADQAFYGTTSCEGPDGGGTVFKVWGAEAPEILGITRVNGVSQVGFSGQAGANYQVLRSTDLTSWIVLTTITMPTAGVYHYADDTSPNQSAYYRASWVP